MNFENLKSFMNDLTEWRIPGNSVVVYKDNEKVFEYSSGFSDVENKIKMNGSELVNVYSCSKPITVTAAMQLYEKGKFLLSDPLYEFIPEFKEMYVCTNGGEIEKANKPITIQNLFTMTAGFSYNFNTEGFKKAKEITNGKMDTLATIRCIADDPLVFQPGEHWGYSIGHDVLAAVVEVISGKKFRDYVKENIFDPLEMNDSCYHNEGVRDRMAEQYLFKVGDEDDIVKLQSSDTIKDGGYIENTGKQVAHVLGCEYDSGGAGITTSISDYGKFAAAMANGGVGLNGEKIISAATINLMRTNQLNQNQSADFNWEQLRGYGYGLGVRTMINKAVAGSNGSIGEFGWGGAAGATLLVDPDCNLGVFYAHHMLNPQEGYYQPRLRNVIYSCF